MRYIFRAALLLFTLVRLHGAPIDPNNILVALKYEVREYSPLGVLVQTIPFNYGGRDYPYCCPSSEELHGIVVDQYGWIDSFNGTWYPFMSRYSPDSNAFAHKTFPDWSATGSTYSGHLTAWQNFIFAADAGSNLGLVRFDLFNNTAARFLPGKSFIDVKAGLDGKLYTLSSSSADIYVYDPATLQQVGYLAKPASIGWIIALAVDQAGRVLVASNDGTVSRLSSSGAVEATVSTGSTGLMDISVDETGRLIVAKFQGQVFVGDTTLTNGFTSFLTGDNPASVSSIFVSFAHPVPPPVGPVATPSPTPQPTPTPTPTHDIIVSLGQGVAGIGNGSENSLLEFTPDGSLVRTIRFNYNGGAYPYTECLRDVVVGQDGGVYGFNGTFYPLLTRFSWECTAFAHTSFSGWSTVNGPTLGGIAAYQNFIYATDMTTGTQANGIVRFDTSNNTATRFENGTDFWHLNIGLDGRLYAMPSSGGINVYDPLAMQPLGHIALPQGVGSGKIAVDQAGRIFLVSSYGTVYRLSSNGTLETSVATGFPNLTDIKIDETGRLIMVSDEGYVITSDSTLGNFIWFPAIRDGNTWMINVALAPLAPAPPISLRYVASRKTHGNAGTFDIYLPPAGRGGPVECRGGGVNGDYTLVFAFSHALLRVGGVCCKGATVSSGFIDPTNTQQYVLNLTGITNSGYVTVTLEDLDGSEGTHNNTVSAEMAVLVGDTNGDGVVNSADIGQTKSQSGTLVTDFNFREDLNEDGVINSADIGFVKSKSGTALPSLP